MACVMGRGAVQILRCLRVQHNSPLRIIRYSGARKSGPPYAGAAA